MYHQIFVEMESLNGCFSCSFMMITFLVTTENMCLFQNGEKLIQQDGGLKLSWVCLCTYLEKVLNFPQAKNSEIYNVLKIVRLATKDNKKYVY